MRFHTIPLLLALAAVFHSCKRTAKDMIAKKWQAIEITGGEYSDEPIDTDSKKQMLAHMGIEFKKDWQYQSHTSDGMVRRGTYAFANNDHVLLFFLKDKIIDSGDIDSLTDNKLIITARNKIKISFIPE